MAIDHTPPDLNNGRPVLIGSPWSTVLSILGIGSDGRLGPASGYSGSEAVAGVFVPGDGLPVAWTPTVAWQSPFDGDAPAVLVSWEGETTEEVDPGVYYLDLTIDGATDRVGHLSLIAGANASGAITPTPIASLSDLKSRAGSWVEVLTSAHTTAGLKRALALGTADLHALIVERYAGSYRGWGEAEARTAMETALATPANLTVSTPMIDYVCYRALWHLVGFAPESKDGKGQMARLAMEAERRAEMARRRIVAVVSGYPPIPLGGAIRLERG